MVPAEPSMEPAAATASNSMATSISSARRTGVENHRHHGLQLASSADSASEIVP